MAPNRIGREEGLSLLGKCAVALIGVGVLHWRPACLLASFLALFVLYWRGAPHEYHRPQISESPFLNTSSDVEFVGGRRCIECHVEQFESYRETAHSKSFREVEPKREPPDGTFYHPKSGHNYGASRVGSRLFHKESLPLTGAEILLGNYPLRYVIGSGRFGQTYVAEVNGFLVQSPISWYSKGQTWGMSPGYDVPGHSSFERPIRVGCLSCHTGRVEPRDGSGQRVSLQEEAIGCESCHGPGALHVQHRSEHFTRSDALDHTIVNPKYLSRDLQEAICARCHFQADVTVNVRGDDTTTFRPGLPLEDFLLHYRFGAARESMTVVGHVEQLRQSKCYQNSETLTCTTCHNPHVQTPKEQAAEYYRAKCMTCHASEHCTAPPIERTRASNDCVGCHMPSSTVETPHTVFRHHRIGVQHPTAMHVKEGVSPDAVPVPLDDLSRLPEVDQERCLSLAYAELFTEHQHRKHRDEAVKLLEKVRRRGVRDPVVEASLAELCCDTLPSKAVGHAHAALAYEQLSPKTRESALLSLQVAATKLSDFELAERALEQLVQIRHSADIWRELGICRERRGDYMSAARAWRQAAEIRPGDPGPHQALAKLYHVLGQQAQAAHHRTLALQLLNAGGGPLGPAGPTSR